MDIQGFVHVSNPPTNYLDNTDVYWEQFLSLLVDVSS